MKMIVTAVAFINAAADLAQGTGFQIFKEAVMLMIEVYLVNFNLFNPSSTTFVKHFIAKTTWLCTMQYSINNYIAGYVNTTAAVDAIQFKMIW